MNNPFSYTNTGRKGKKGFTLAELCVVGGVVGIVGAIGVGVALLVGGGTIGFNILKKHIAYEDKYYEALSLANKDSALEQGALNLDSEEVSLLMNDLGVTLWEGETFKEARPSYDSLDDYVKAFK